MVAVTSNGKAIKALGRDLSDRSTKVRTDRKRRTAMIPDSTGESTHEATMPAIPCISFDWSIGRSTNELIVILLVSQSIK